MITTLKEAQRIINSSNEHLAFIIGNGINRFAFDNRIDTSWGRLLLDAWDGASFSTLSSIGKGITYTEFYDILEMEADPKDITASIIARIKNWGTAEYHDKLRNALMRIDRPVLTTNFDLCLEGESMQKTIVRHPTVKRGFSPYYPWEVVYTPDPKFSISDIYKFGIWHVNGCIDYPSSLKLSLSSYTRQGRRAVDFLHSKNYEDDFNGKDMNGHGSFI